MIIYMRRVHHVHHRTDDCGDLNLCRCALKSEFLTALRTKCCCCFAFIFLQQDLRTSAGVGGTAANTLLNLLPCPLCTSNPVNFHKLSVSLVFSYKKCPFDRDTKPTATALSLRWSWQIEMCRDSLYYSLKIHSQIAHSEIEVRDGVFWGFQDANGTRFKSCCRPPENWWLHIVNLNCIIQLTYPYVYLWRIWLELVVFWRRPCCSSNMARAGEARFDTGPVIWGQRPAERYRLWGNAASPLWCLVILVHCKMLHRNDAVYRSIVCVSIQVGMSFPSAQPDTAPQTRQGLGGLKAAVRDTEEPYH